MCLTKQTPLIPCQFFRRSDRIDHNIFSVYRPVIFFLIWVFAVLVFFGRFVRSLLFLPKYVSYVSHHGSVLLTRVYVWPYHDGYSVYKRLSRELVGRFRTTRCRCAQERASDQLDDLVWPLAKTKNDVVREFRARCRLGTRF